MTHQPVDPSGDTFAQGSQLLFGKCQQGLWNDHGRVPVDWLSILVNAFKVRSVLLVADIGLLVVRVAGVSGCRHGVKAGVESGEKNIVH